MCPNLFSSFLATIRLGIPVTPKRQVPRQAGGAILQKHGRPVAERGWTEKRGHRQNGPRARKNKAGPRPW